MVQKDRFRLLLCVFFLGAFIFVYPAFAEIKIFEKERNKTVSNAPNWKMSSGGMTWRGRRN